MPAEAYSPVKGKLLRVTKLGVCGEPLFHPDDPGWPVHAVAKCFASVEYSPEIDDGEEIDEQDANGDRCVVVAPCPSIKWQNVTVTVKRVDPDLFSLLTGVPVVLNPDGIATGFRIQTRVNCDTGVALEAWTGTAADQRCIGGGTPELRFGYFLIPFLTNAVIGDFTIENGLASFSIAGKGIAGGAWGVGPYDVYRTVAAGVTPLADPIGPLDLLHGDLTTLPPPAVWTGIVPRPHQYTLAAGADAQTAALRMTHVPAGQPPHASTVDWGDGTPPVPGPAAVGPPGITHRYTTPGRYVVTVADTATGAVRRRNLTVPIP